MAKRFFYAAGGVLLLAVAYQIGAGAAVASFSQSNALGVVAVSGVTDPWHGVVLLESGAIVEIREDGFEVCSSVCPVPVGDVLAFEGLRGGVVSDNFRGFIVTRSGEVWTHGNNPGWQNIGQIPGTGPTAVGAQSFGKIKGAHR